MHRLRRTALSLGIIALLAALAAAPVIAKDITGTERADTLIGTPLQDHIHGLAGDDAIWGLRAGDYIEGGKGDDVIHGGQGRDHIRGVGGDDTIFGGDGQDALRGSPGADLISGGPRDDKIYAAGDDGYVDRVRCGRGEDTVYADPSDIVGDGCEIVVIGAP